MRELAEGSRNGNGNEREPRGAGEEGSVRTAGRTDIVAEGQGVQHRRNETSRTTSDTTYFLYRFPLPGLESFIPALIGPGGSRVRQICSKAGVTLRYLDSRNRGSQYVGADSTPQCLIQGTAASIRRALDLIRMFPYFDKDSKLNDTFDFNLEYLFPISHKRQTTDLELKKTTPVPDRRPSQPNTPTLNEPFLPFDRNDARASPRAPPLEGYSIEIPDVAISAFFGPTSSLPHLERISGTRLKLECETVATRVVVGRDVESGGIDPVERIRRLKTGIEDTVRTIRGCEGWKIEVDEYQAAIPSGLESVSNDPEAGRCSSSPSIQHQSPLATEAQDSEVDRCRDRSMKKEAILSKNVDRQRDASRISVTRRQAQMNVSNSCEDPETGRVVNRTETPLLPSHSRPSSASIRRSPHPLSASPPRAREAFTLPSSPTVSHRHHDHRPYSPPFDSLARGRSRSPPPRRRHYETHQPRHDHRSSRSRIRTLDDGPSISAYDPLCQLDSSIGPPIHLTITGEERRRLREKEERALSRKSISRRGGEWRGKGPLDSDERYKRFQGGRRRWDGSSRDEDQSRRSLDRRMSRQEMEEQERFCRRREERSSSDDRVGSRYNERSEGEARRRRW